MKQLVALAPLAALLLSAVSSAQTTWLVGPGPAADFPTLRDGIQAAADGDVLLLLTGAEAGGPLTIADHRRQGPHDRCP